MTENEELEEANRLFNEKMEKRPKLNLRTCPRCGNHPYLKRWSKWICKCGAEGNECFGSEKCIKNYENCDAELKKFRCKNCHGKGYVNNPA